MPTGFFLICLYGFFVELLLVGGVVACAGSALYQLFRACVKLCRSHT